MSSCTPMMMRASRGSMLGQDHAGASHAGHEQPSCRARTAAGWTGSCSRSAQGTGHSTQYTAHRAASRQARKQARKHASEQTSKPATTQAGAQAGTQTSYLASHAADKHASKQARKQTNRQRHTFQKHSFVEHPSGFGCAGGGGLIVVV